MTRSQQKHLSRTAAFNKNVRHKAQHDGVTFSTALTQKLKEIDEDKTLKGSHRMVGYTVPAAGAAISTRRNPGRMDGVTWKGSDFIPIDDSRAHVEASAMGVDSDDTDYDDYDYEQHVYAPSSTPTTTSASMDDADTPYPHSSATSINLLDIARPAKRKGPAKEFQVVSLRNVIALDDEGDSYRYRRGHWDGDESVDGDWEEIYEAEHKFIGQPSYSEVLTHWQDSDT